tara:strand:+ start:1420 stop:2568 length:1149 start_codon:yes stop_codon:yes gene_type:complete
MNGRFFNRDSKSIAVRWWHDIDKVSFLIICGLMVFGLMVCATSTTHIAKKIGVEKFYFLKKQFSFAIVSFSIMIFISMLKRQYVKILALVGLAGAIVMLVLVSVLGFEIKGARRWLSIFGFVIQPSEFAKTFFVVANAYILYQFNSYGFTVKYGFSAILFLLISTLLVIQPDIGMTLTVCALWASQLFVNGISMYFVLLCLFLACVGIFSAYLFLPHVEDRINRFLDLESKNYQVERSLDAFANGGYLGLGQGNGVVKGFIPDSHTDFVFAVISEEYGSLTAILLLVLFFILIIRIVKFLLKENDRFIYLCLFGLMIQFTMQLVINTGVSMRLFPTKGMTLPLISYGGSSMLSMGFCFGLILNFTKKRYHSNIDYGNLKMVS